uniref:uncharacterized protein LOC117165153 n=1 Tax=Bombus vancouverensis nearcticus TaxID=2705178 RepID=UPI00143AC604|nr:uncharacterized protein LOC117165153 [Bombus vancouverensis nearcticus]
MRKLESLIDEEWAARFEEQRRELREDAKRKIAATQEENRRNYNKKRKSAKQYQRGDLVAIKRTQFGAGLKLGGRFLGPYRVVRAMRNDRYTVEKVGEHEGPAHTSTTADFMKPWVLNAEDDASDDSENEHNI